MTTSQQKDTILSIIYKSCINCPSGNICSDYESLKKDSGLKEHVFSLAYNEIYGHGFIDDVGQDQETTYLEITDKGKYFFEKGGYTAKEKKEKGQAKWKRTGDWIQKFVPVIISAATLILATVVFWKQTESDKTIKSQKVSIDSLTASIKKVEHK
ncbi:hypothetical protein LC612_40670 [Nostoc sp. CHAB 5834]|nr:hypothetical protein [Nostoc sp. CHAB 5834]